MSKLRKALEKAEQTRRKEREDPFVSEIITVSPPSAARAEKPEKGADKVNPVYTSTKVEHIDFQQLEKRKIISICHGNEVADQLKILRTQVIHHIKESGGNSLLIASANPGEGRTVTAINLAISLSQQIDGTVLLIDTDLRNPSIHKLLGFQVSQGLSDYLRGKAELHEVLVNPGMPRLVVLPGGRPVQNSSELLDAPRMKSLVKEMKERYPDRFLIFDSSPLLTSADPLVLSRFVDGILIVVEAEKTTKDDVTRIMDLLQNRPVIGTILNKAK